MSNLQDLIGQKFHRLTITEVLNVVGHRRYCMAICECGKLRKHDVRSLKGGKTKSCGCLRTESNLTGNNKRSHGLHEHPLYQTWIGIKDRCYCTTDKAYTRYGGNGVVMCDEWLNDFMAFYNWAIENGWKKGLHLDKDKLSPNKTGKIYSPEFCSFITQDENILYRSDSLRITHKGESKTLAEWCKILKLRGATIRSRIFVLGWDANTALETPIKKRRING